MCIPYPSIFIYPACFKPFDSAVNRSCFLFKLQRSAADGSGCIVEKNGVITISEVRGLEDIGFKGTYNSNNNELQYIIAQLSPTSPQL